MILYFSHNDAGEVEKDEEQVGFCPCLSIHGKIQRKMWNTLTPEELGLTLCLCPWCGSQAKALGTFRINENCWLSLFPSAHIKGTKTKGKGHLTADPVVQDFPPGSPDFFSFLTLTVSRVLLLPE